MLEAEAGKYNWWGCDLRCLKCGRSAVTLTSGRCAALVRSQGGGGSWEPPSVPSETSVMSHLGSDFLRQSDL